MTRRHIVLGAVAVLCAACASDQPTPTAVELRVPLFEVGGNAGGNADVNLGTHLSGAEEVLAVTEGAPHPRDSRAQGQAIFRVSDDGSSVQFRLIASNIENVIMAHIHCGRPGENGPAVMWLYPVIGPSGSPGPSSSGRHDGVLAADTFSPGSVMCAAANVGQNMPLLAAMRAGLTYVNVHTDNGGTRNTGPGDFFGGEIRGQLDHGSSHANR